MKPGNSYAFEVYRRALRNFSAQFPREGFLVRNANRLKGGGKHDGIIIFGMGGSGLAGSVIKELAATLRIPVPVVVWKNYGLPSTHFRNPLHLFVSFSGNTEEVLSGFREVVKQKGSMVAAVTSGGELARLAEQAGIAYVRFPGGGLTPRKALGYTYGSCIALLRIRFPEIRPVKQPHLPGTGVFEVAGQRLARSLKGRVPLVYTSASHQALGYIWKISLNETAKTPAFANVIPEMSHNEIAGFERSGKEFVAVFLEDASGRAEIRKKTTILKRTLSARGVRVLGVPLKGSSPEIKLWSGFLLAHWTALYLAQGLGMNPLETKVIEEMKVLLRRK